MATQTEYAGLQNKVLARVGERPGETSRELASYLEAERRSVSRALSRLLAGDKVFRVDGQYFPVVGDFDRFVKSAEMLERSARSLHTVRSWRVWWRRLGRLAGAPWLGLPALMYPVAAVASYGFGRWFT